MIDSLFIPKTIDGFWDAFYKRERFIVHNKQDTFDSILSVTELNNFFKRRDLIYPSVQLAQNARPIPKEQYTIQDISNEFIDSDLFFSLFNQGSSIIIYYADHFFDNLYSICREMESSFNFKISPTIFISPQQE